MNYIGIDPGKSGGLAFIEEDNLGRTRHVDFWKFKDRTERDVWEGLNFSMHGSALAVIEKVGATPQMGVVSSFTFGQNFGFWIGCLTAAGIPYVMVSPQKWQKALGCLSKGNKNVTKAKAQQLYPNEKITHAVADALLLATYCKQNHAQLF